MPPGLLKRLKPSRASGPGKWTSWDPSYSGSSTEVDPNLPEKGNGARNLPRPTIDPEKLEETGRSPPVLFLLHLAVDAVSGVRKGIQTLKAHLRATGMADPEVLRIVVKPTKRFLDAVEVSPLLRGEEGSLLPLHRLGALIRHVIGVGGKRRVPGFPVRFRHLIEEPQSLLGPGTLLE